MKKENKQQSANVNYIWVLAGGYLVYMGGDLLYNLWKGNTDLTPLLLIPAALLFIAVGGLLLRREGKAYKYAMEHKDDPSTWSDEPLVDEVSIESAEKSVLPESEAEDAPEDGGEETL